MEHGIRIAPSLMCMDLMRIADGIAALDGFADEYHADILDWHYCRNMSLAPCFVEGVRTLTDKPIECHLYVDNIEADLVELCIKSGASTITMPPEIIADRMEELHRLCAEAHVGFGLFLNPGTTVAEVEPYAELLDRLLVMTVPPGFPGQAFVESTLHTIEDAAALRAERGLHYDIEVDGCCNEAWYRRLRDAGADTFVIGGSGLFGKDPDTAHAIAICRENLAHELA